MAIAALAGVSVMLAACSSSGANSTGSSPSNLAPVKQSGAAAVAKCQAVQVGPFTQCENFYTAYWPTIKANMAKLYQQALKTDGGNLVTWEYYAPSPAETKAFNKDFPGIKVSGRGYQLNLPTAVISAKATGARNSDTVDGSISSMQALYDQHYWQKIDWTKYGVPKEFLQNGGQDTGLLPSSLNGFLMSYNTSKVPSMPKSLDDLTTSQWKGKLAIDNYYSQFFAGYGVRYGQAKMDSLIKKLKSSSNLQVVNDTTSLLSTGDRPVAFGNQLYSPNPDLAVAPYQASDIFVDFSGVNTDAKNAPAAMLFELWNAFDPAWLKTRMTDPAYATSSMPYPGLPTSVFNDATGLIKKNITAYVAAIKDPTVEVETFQNRDKIIAMAKRAATDMNG